MLRPRFRDRRQLDNVYRPLRANMSETPSPVQITVQGGKGMIVNE